MKQGPRVLPFSIAAAFLVSGLQRAEEPVPAADRAPIPPLHEGTAAIEESIEAARNLLAADAAMSAQAWSEAAAILDALAPPARGAGARIRSGDPALVTADRILYTPATLEARRRVKKLVETAGGRDAWRARRGDDAEPATAAEGTPAAAPASAAAGEWIGVLGRPDRAAPEAGTPPVELGSYARWAHRLTNYRKLESSQPARNYYYAYFPMQAATWKDLVFIRSHQDIVALAASTGEVRWRFDSAVPAAEQSSKPSGSSGFNSFQYFSDIGGWAVSVVPGEPDRVVAISRPARGSVTSNVLSFAASQLLAFEAATGAPSWKRGGPEDPSEALRSLSFAAPPAESLAGGKRVLAAPAVSVDGYSVVGLAPTGDLVWLTKVYAFAPSKLTAATSSLALGASLAASGPFVVGAPGHGVVFALGEGGELLWERRYASSIRESPYDPRWAPGHPIVAAGVAVAAPFDGESLMAIDLETGVLLWEERLASGYHALLGADRERVYRMDMDGRITAATLRAGSAVWTTEPLGAPAGRGFVASGRIHAAADGQVVVLESSTGGIISRSRIWDDRIEAPAPGNLFPSRAGLLAMGPWGIACIETHDESWKGLDSLGLRERRLRKSRLCRTGGKYEEALHELREVLATAGDPTEVMKLKTELLDVAQEASRVTRDAAFIQRVLGEPDLVPSPEHRIGFLLRSAEILRESAPVESARLYAELAAGSADAVVETPEGMIADARTYASDCLRELASAGTIAALETAEEAAGAELERADTEEKLLAVARRPHVLAAARAHALLSSMAAGDGHPAAAANHLERLVHDFPSLASAEVRARLEELRAEASGAAPPLRDAGLDLERPWRRVFESEAPGAALFAMAEGSDPLPGLLLLESRGAVLLDGTGRRASSFRIDGLPALERMRDRISGVLLEPAVAHARADRILLFTGAGVHEALGVGGGESGVRVWHRLEHPLLPQLGPAGEGGRDETPAKKKASFNDNSNLYPRVEFPPDGSPHVVEARGSLTVLDRASGRIRYRSTVPAEKPAGAPRPAGHLIAVESADPRGVVLHDLAARSRLVVGTPGTPWRAELVPGIALVVETSDGIQVRELAPGFPTLWRDRRPRGLPSLAHADAVQVIASERGGKLTSRSLRSGRLRWSAPFPPGACPLRTIRLDGKDGGPDLILASSRDIDPEDGRGLLGSRLAQDLFFTRIAFDGTKRWEVQAARGGVAFEPTRWILPDGKWIVVWNESAGGWRTRASVLDPGTGALRSLFEHPLASSPNLPPPRWCVTTLGIGVGTLEGWALYAPER